MGWPTLRSSVVSAGPGSASTSASTSRLSQSASSPASSVDMLSWSMGPISSAPVRSTAQPPASAWSTAPIAPAPPPLSRRPTTPPRSESTDPRYRPPEDWNPRMFGYDRPAPAHGVMKSRLVEAPHAGPPSFAWPATNPTTAESWSGDGALKAGRAPSHSVWPVRATKPQSDMTTDDDGWSRDTNGPTATSTILPEPQSVEPKVQKGGKTRTDLRWSKLAKTHRPIIRLLDDRLYEVLVEPGPKDAHVAASSFAPVPSSRNGGPVSELGLSQRSWPEIAHPSPKRPADLATLLRSPSPPPQPPLVVPAPSTPSPPQHPALRAHTPSASSSWPSPLSSRGAALSARQSPPSSEMDSDEAPMSLPPTPEPVVAEDEQRDAIWPAADEDATTLRSEDALLALIDQLTEAPDMVDSIHSLHLLDIAVSSAPLVALTNTSLCTGLDQLVVRFATPIHDLDALGCLFAPDQAAARTLVIGPLYGPSINVQLLPLIAGLAPISLVLGSDSISFVDIDGAQVRLVGDDLLSGQLGPLVQRIPSVRQLRLIGRGDFAPTTVIAALRGEGVVPDLKTLTVEDASGHWSAAKTRSIVRLLELACTRRGITLIVQA